MAESYVPYTSDQYLCFTWNGKNSEEFNCFITNDGTKLKAVGTPVFSNTFTSPMFHTSSFLSGVSVERKNITLELALDKITMSTYRQFLKWMNINTVGLLQFNYENYYGYKCKLSQLSEAVIHPVEMEAVTYGTTTINEMTYIITLTAVFETIENSNAVSQYVVTGYYPYTTTSGTSEHFGSLYNKLGLTELDIRRVDTVAIKTYVFTIDFYNFGDLAVPFKLNISGFNGSAELKKGDDIIFSTVLNTDLMSDYCVDLEYNSLTGAISSGPALIESLTIAGTAALVDKTAVVGQKIEPTYYVSNPTGWTKETYTLTIIRTSNYIVKINNINTVVAPELIIQYAKEVPVV